MKDRLPVLITDHVMAIVDYLDTYLGTLAHPVPVGFGERPVAADKSFEEPPYAMVTVWGGGQTSGPLDDTQADIILPIMIVSNGNTAHEASVLRDIIHAQMQASNFAVANRKVRDVRTQGVTDGIFRDDDVPTPIHYTRQVYLMDTTPA